MRYPQWFMLTFLFVYVPTMGELPLMILYGMVVAHFFTRSIPWLIHKFSPVAIPSYSMWQRFVDTVMGLFGAPLK